MCEIAVGQNGIALRWVPDKLKTKEMCEIAVGNDGNALQYVPDKWKTLF